MTTPKQRFRTGLSLLAAGYHPSPRRPSGTPSYDPPPPKETIGEREALLLRELLKPKNERRLVGPTISVVYERLYQDMGKQGLVVWTPMREGYASLGDWWEITNEGREALKLYNLVMSGNYGVRVVYDSPRSRKSGIDTWQVLVDGKPWGWVHHDEKNSSEHWIVSEGARPQGAKIVHDHKGDTEYSVLNITPIRAWIKKRVGR